MHASFIKKFVIVSLYFLFLSCPAFASITGTVTDSQSNTVTGALVRFIDESDESLEYNAYTNSSGQYEISLPVNVEYNAPKVFKLEQNYPNPFNPSTTIPFELSCETHVRLSIYNVMGQLVKTLVNNPMSSGFHTITWDSRDESGRAVSSGIYIYRLTAGNYDMSRKMVLVDGQNVSSVSSRGIRKYSATKPSLSGSYTLIIECDGYVPYIHENLSIIDNSVHDYCLARNDDPLKIALVRDPESPIAFITMNQEGESAGILVDRTGVDTAERVTGAYYMSSAGKQLAMWFGSDGLPEQVYTDGWTILFANYTDTTVDITFISDEGTVEHVNGVELNEEVLAELRNLIDEGTFSRAVGADGASLKVNGSVNIKNLIVGSLKGASLGLSMVSCAASIAAVAGSGGIFIPVAGIVCYGMFKKAWELGEWAAGGEGNPNVNLKASGTGAGAITAAETFNLVSKDIILSKGSQVISSDAVLGISTSIAALGVDLLIDAIEKQETVEETFYSISGIVTKDGAGLEGVEVTISGNNINTTFSSDNNGSYKISGLKAGSYTLTYSKSGYMFNPATINVTVNGADVKVQDVSATQSGGTHIISNITFASIPGGTFQMGSTYYASEQPIHTVTVSGFEMSIYEITQGQYQSVIGSNPSNTYGVGDNYPVYNVTWYDAVKFCNKLSDAAGLNRCYNETSWTCDFSKNGFRLPTEAEWEYACRAGTTTYFYTGNNLSGDGRTSTDLDRAGWYYYNWGNTNNKSHEVGKKEPNAFGLYDMHGNVWEWCNDWWTGSYSAGSVTDPTGPFSGSYRVFRGGSWSYDALDCRSADRRGDLPSYTLRPRFPCGPQAVTDSPFERNRHQKG